MSSLVKSYTLYNQTSKIITDNLQRTEKPIEQQFGANGKKPHLKYFCLQEPSNYKCCHSYIKSYMIFL